MFRERGIGTAVDRRLQFGERVIQVARGMAVPFAMDDPPLQFEAPDAVHIERCRTRPPDQAVVTNEVRQGSFVILARMAGLKDHRRPRRIICAETGAPEWQVELAL